MKRPGTYLDPNLAKRTFLKAKTRLDGMWTHEMQHLLFPLAF